MIEVVRKEIMVSASVSCMDLCNLKREIGEVEKSEVSFFHFDVVDGHFNKCFILGETTLQQMRSQTKLPIEAHLAVYEPEKFIESYVKSGADYIAVHYEAMENPLKIFNMIRKFGAEPILAYKSTTAPGDDFISLAKEVPWVLKLTVNPGFSGQKMHDFAVDDIKRMRDMLNDEGLKTGIQADGNINVSTIPAVRNAGADIFTGGTSGLFLKEKSIEECCGEMLKAAR
ncbi:MAG: ribulose-phosphate 3-epimerase [Clostridiaceae bacterium]